MQVDVNYLAVLAAGVASMIIGFIWYSPFLLGNPWMKLRGVTKEQMQKDSKKLGGLYAITFVLSLVSAYILTHVIAFSTNFYHYAPLTTGLTSAFWMWLGFVMPVQATEQMFGEKKFALFTINTGYQLVCLLVTGAIIVLM